MAERASRRMGAALAAALVAALAVASPRASAAPAAATGAAGITRAQADSILGELRQVHALLDRVLQQGTACAPSPAPAPQRRVTLPPASTAFELGRKDAPVTLVEFADYACPFCRQFDVATFEPLKRDFIDTGKLRFVVRDMPLPMHAAALPAANAARCAGEQGRFWEMRHVLMVNSDKLSPDQLLTYARDLQLDMPRFQACMDGSRYDSAIRKDMADAAAAGISATPSFVLGTTSRAAASGLLLVGAMPISDLEARIRALLADPR